VHTGASDSTMTEAARAAIMCYNEDRSMTGFVSPDAQGTCARSTAQELENVWSLLTIHLCKVLFAVWSLCMFSVAASEKVR